MSNKHHHSKDYPGYVEEYEKWVNSLSPEERGELKRHGLDRPDLPSHCANAREIDLADSSLASERPDIARQIDQKNLPSTERSDVDETRGDILASFCSRIRSCSRPALVFDAICYATGVLALEGKSATELAVQHGVTKQAFSKIAVEWCETFGLRPSRSMKSKRARGVYRKRAHRVHSKRRLTQRTRT